MTAPLRLTADHLTVAEACEEQVALFRQTFPDGAPLTLESIAAARAAGLNVEWCLGLMDTPAREEYHRAIAPAWEAYDRAVATAEEAYDRAVATAWGAYDRAIAPAEEAYERATAPALLAGLIATFTRKGNTP